MKIKIKILLTSSPCIQNLIVLFENDGLTIIYVLFFSTLLPWVTYFCLRRHELAKRRAIISRQLSIIGDDILLMHIPIMSSLRCNNSMEGMLFTTVSFFMDLIQR